jgi:exodeoxyribonuclease-3
VRIISWNVNGLRACAKKGFADFLHNAQADVIGVQEVRAFAPQLPIEVRAPAGWHANFAPAERAGYSGVGIFSKEAPSRVETSLGDPAFDIEGRFIAAHFGRMAIASVYFPKGSGKERDNSRVPYKMDFYRAVFERIEHLRKRGPVYVMGDYNTAHADIDLARPKTNRKASGFLPEERDEMSRWLDAGWVDTFRRQHPAAGGHYTWWRQWGNAREYNVGWRIDYILASATAAKKVRSAFIWPQIRGSDHCPIGADLR